MNYVINVAYFVQNNCPTKVTLISNETGAKQILISKLTRNLAQQDTPQDATTGIKTNPQHTLTTQALNHVP
jgi:hypothetical protein